MGRAFDRANFPLTQLLLKSQDSEVYSDLDSLLRRLHEAVAQDDQDGVVKVIGQVRSLSLVSNNPLLSLLWGTSVTHLGSLRKDDSQACVLYDSARKAFNAYLALAPGDPLITSEVFEMISGCAAESALRCPEPARMAVSFLESIVYQTQALKAIQTAVSSKINSYGSNDNLEELIRKQIIHRKRGLGTRLLEYASTLERIPDGKMIEISREINGRKWKGLPKEWSLLHDPAVYSVGRRHSILSFVYLLSFLQYKQTLNEDGGFHARLHLAKSLCGLGRAQAKRIYDERIGMYFVDNAIMVLDDLQANSVDPDFLKAVDVALADAYLSRGENHNRLENILEAIRIVESRFFRDPGHGRIDLEGHRLVGEAYHHLGDHIQNNPVVKIPQGVPAWFDSRDIGFTSRMSYALSLLHYDHHREGKDCSVEEQHILAALLKVNLSELASFSKSARSYESNPGQFQRELLISKLEGYAGVPRGDPRWKAVLTLLDSVPKDFEHRLRTQFSHDFGENLLRKYMDEARSLVSDVYEIFLLRIEKDPDDPRPYLNMMRVFDMLDKVYNVVPKRPINRQSVSEGLVDLIRNHNLLTQAKWMTRCRGGFFGDLYISNASPQVIALIRQLIALKRSVPEYAELALPDIVSYSSKDDCLMMKVIGKDLPTIFQDIEDERRIHEDVARSCTDKIKNRLFCEHIPVGDVAKDIFRPWLTQWVLVESAYNVIFQVPVPRALQGLPMRRFVSPLDYRERLESCVGAVPYVLNDFAQARLFSAFGSLSEKLAAMPRGYYKDHNASNCTQNKALTCDGFVMAMIDFENVKHTHYNEDLASLLLHEGTPLAPQEIFDLAQEIGPLWNSKNRFRARHALDFQKDLVYACIDKLFHKIEHKQRSLWQLEDWTATSDEKARMEKQAMAYQQGYLERMRDLIGYSLAHGLVDGSDKEFLMDIFGLVNGLKIHNSPRYSALGVPTPRDLLEQGLLDVHKDVHT